MSSTHGALTWHWESLRRGDPANLFSVFSPGRTLGVTCGDQSAFSPLAVGSTQRRPALYVDASPRAHAAGARPIQPARNMR